MAKMAPQTLVPKPLPDGQDRDSEGALILPAPFGSVIPAQTGVRDAWSQHMATRGYSIATLRETNGPLLNCQDGTPDTCPKTTSRRAGQRFRRRADTTNALGSVIPAQTRVMDAWSQHLALRGNSIASFREPHGHNFSQRRLRHLSQNHFPTGKSEIPRAR